MATTTNYGWTTPDDTALVKDGAAAIRTLGSSIDTSLNTALGTKKAGTVLLSTTTFSAVSSQSFNSVFSSTYDFYMVNIIWSSTASSNLFVRFRESGADITTNYYGSGFEYAYNNTHANFGAVNNGSTMNVGQTNTTKGSNLIGYFTSEKGSGGCVVSALNGQMYGAGTGSIFTYASDVGSADGFTIYPSSGTITGTLSLYGVNK